MRVDPKRLLELSDENIDALRTALVNAEYDERRVTACESIAPRQLDAVRVPAVLHELARQDDAAAVLTAVFAYAGEVASERLLAVLGDAAFGALEKCGVLVHDGDRVRSLARILPYRGVWIASDDFHDEDPVMGPGLTTDELAQCISFAATTTLLDIGCGAGSLALVAAATGVPTVVGTDIDPRAIDYARFNGRLNRLHCEWLVGDLAAPVTGRKFDVVVSQPAYVAQPEAIEGVTFLHGGPRGDELAMRLLGELPELLGTRGRAWVLFDTPEPGLREISTSVKAALGQAQLDVALLATPGHAAADQAIGYASLRDRSLGDGYASTYRDYRDHLAKLGVDRVRHVLAYVRVSTSPVGYVAEPTSLGGYTAKALARVLDSVRWSAASGSDLLDADVRPNSAARLVHEQSLSGVGDERLWVRFERGAGVEQELSDTAAVLALAMRDQQPLRAAIEAWVMQLHGSDDVDMNDMIAQALTFVRQGLRSGLLVVGE
jgi:methylase of polypeptide subunit release factors